MESEHPFESELIARIGWLIQLRWVAAIGTAAAIVVTALGVLLVGLYPSWLLNAAQSALRLVLGG